MDESELLFTDILGCDRVSLYLNKSRLLGKDAGARISRVLKKRIQGEPLEYILGKTEFMGLEFKVTPDVLIPRPDTEILVETVLQLIKERYGPGMASGTLNILEIGAGSGCIAVALAKYLPQSRIIAVDISQKALDIAGENSRLNGVDRNIDFVRADLFDSRRIKQAGYDIIVSNPPYVGTAEIPGLAPEVRCQPEIALYAGEEGLDIYRRLIPQSADYLKPGGLLCLEIGYSQMDRVKEIFRSVEKFAVKRTVKDYNNIERVILARLNDSALS